MYCLLFYGLSLFLRTIDGQELFPSKITFEESTDVYFGDQHNGTAAAFVDYNGDGLPDVFAISEDGHSVEVFAKDDSAKRWVPGGVAVYWPNASIVSVTPADFTGDEIMDLLVLVVFKGEGASIQGYVHKGDDNLHFGPPILVSDDLLNQPIAADYDFNMVADVFGAKKDGTLNFWVYESDKAVFTPKQIAGADPKKAPLNYAFVSLSRHDLVPGLFVESHTDTGSSYDFYHVSTGGSAGNPSWSLVESRSHNLTWGGVIGLSTFVDVNADGSIDQVVPLCDKAECTKSSIQYYKFTQDGGQWVELVTAEDLGDWHFVAPKEPPTKGEVTVGMKLREGDVNLDSYADFVCIMRQGSNQTNEVVLLINNKGTSLKLDPAIPPTAGSALVASFVDISTTALLDIIINIQEKNSPNRFHLLTSPFFPDANFIKVEVVMRTCGGSKCTTKSHVSNQPGPVIQYATTTPSGERQHLIAPLLSQTSHLSLQLPYVIMGLGQNPNFVDNVTVGVPNICCGLGPRRTKSWLSLIPNSQLVVYPAVLDVPKEWESSLIVHPSQSVLLTGVVLIGTCCFIALIAGVLHLLERREDDKQKRQEAHKFHFDAM